MREDKIELQNQNGYKHGNARKLNGKRTPTYLTWTSMKQRCLNPNYDSYNRYGGRGITIQDDWLMFTNFIEDMGERPEGMSLDRIDVNGNYTKDNCRWATRKEQCNNTRRNVTYTIDGLTKTQSEWCDYYGIKQSVFGKRIALGMDIIKALTMPIKNNGRKKNETR